MNDKDKDTHTMEKLENIYESMNRPEEVVEEGIINRNVQGLKSYGQAAGSYLKGLGGALLGRGSVDTGTMRTYYKLVNLVISHANDVNVMSGGNVVDEKEKVRLILDDIGSMAKGQSIHAQRAQKMLSLLAPTLKKGRPNTIKGLTAALKR